MKLTERMRSVVSALAAASQGRRKLTWSMWFQSFRNTFRTEWHGVSRARLYTATAIASVFFISVATVAVTHLNQTTSWVRVFTQGNYIGMVPNRPTILTKMHQIADGYNLDLTLSPIHTSVPANYDWQSVAMLPTSATAIVLDGRPILYTNNLDSAHAVLADVKQALLPQGIQNQHSVQFVGKVSVVSSVVSVANILDEMAAVRYILYPKPNELAARSETSVSLLNPQRPGLTITPKSLVETPLLQLATEATVATIVKVPYDIQYINDNQMGVGSVRVVAHGRSGFAREVLKQHFVNGKLVTQTVITKHVVLSPYAEVAHRGTNNGMASGAWQWPSAMYDITSPFGARNLDGVNGFHPGVDIGCPVGTPVYATNNGRAEEAGWSSGGYGIWVKINNGDGIETVFGHLSSVAIQGGQMISKGELIGYSGETGFATGPHLHYEVRMGGTAINPIPYM